jgi:hypothetical protein
LQRNRNRCNGNPDKSRIRQNNYSEDHRERSKSGAGLQRGESGANSFMKHMKSPMVRTGSVLLPSQLTSGERLALHQR